MPSPNTLQAEALKTLLCSPRIKWEELIKLRIQLIKPFLDRTSLTELENFACMRRGDEFHRLLGSWDDVTFESNRLYCYDRKVQGIFSLPSTARTTSPAPPNDKGIISNGYLKAWGLTREARWVVITVHFDVAAMVWKTTKRDNWTQILGRLATSNEQGTLTDIPRRVIIDEVSYRTLLHRVPIEPRQIVEMLTATTKKFLESRRTAFDDVKQLHEQFVVHDLILQYR